MSLNKVILVGNLGQDPELRYTQGGQACCNFTMATNESWQDKQGVWQKKTEWHRCTLWGKAAESFKSKVSKGSMVYIEGKLQTRKWDTPEGVTKYMTEIVAHNFLSLESNGKKDSPSGTASQTSNGDSGSTQPDPFAALTPPDNLPF